MQIYICNGTLFSYANATPCYPAYEGCYGSDIQLVQDAMGALSSLYAVLCSAMQLMQVLCSATKLVCSAMQPTQVLCITRYRGGVYEAMGAIVMTQSTDS